MNRDDEITTSTTSIKSRHFVVFIILMNVSGQSSYLQHRYQNTNYSTSLAIKFM